MKSQTTKSSLELVASASLGSVIAFLAAAGNAFFREAKASGAEYYVDSRGGNDANAGTGPEAAWKTLEKVDATTFRPGDQILLKSGSVFPGQLWPKGSGTEGHPIRLDVYGGGVKPVINGNGLFEDAVLLKNQEYWEIANLEITNTGPQQAARRGVHIALENYGEAHHIYLRSLTIHDVNGVDHVKPNGGINYTSTSESKPSRFVDLRIENNEIYHVDRSGIFGWSDAWVRSKWNPSLGVVVRGNSLDDIGGDGIVVVATDGAEVENNVVGHANQRSEGYNVAIWAWSADNTLIQHNEAYGTKGQRDGEGFDSDWNSKNTVIQYNYSHDNDGGFLLICNEGGHDPTESAGNTGTTVRYNISQNDRTRGINIAGPVKDSAIYNNTIYVGPEHAVSLLLFSDWHGWSESTRLYNNVFYVAGKGEFTYGISRAKDGAYEVASGFGQSKENILDANVYFGVAPPAADPQALTVDPKLVAPGSGGRGRLSLAGYRLQAGSAARKTGKHIPNSGGQDFWGNRVPSCKQTDRGAVQSDDCAPHDAEVRQREERGVRSIDERDWDGARAPIGCGRGSHARRRAASVHEIMDFESKADRDSLRERHDRHRRDARELWEKDPIPGELSVIGFDNIHLAQYILPPLTTIEMSQAQLGRLAFQALLSDVRRESPNPKGTEYVLKTSFVLRDSTAMNSRKRLS